MRGPTTPDSACPEVTPKKYLDWKLEDPAGRGVEAVRPIRDEIKARIEALIAEIAPAPCCGLGARSMPVSAPRR
jgi:hypothetical protein